MTLQPNPWSTGADSNELSRLFESLCEGAQKVISEATRIFNDTVRTIYKWVPDPIVRLIYNHLVAIRDALDKVWALVKYAIKNATPVVSLILQSFHWIDDVKKPMATMIYDVPKPRDEYLADWTGRVATGYATRWKEQQAAMTAVSNRATIMSDWLMKIAKANVDYMRDLGTLGGELLKKISEMAVKAGTIVRLPMAIDDIAAAVGVAVKAGVDQLMVVAGRFMETLEDMRKLKNELAQANVLASGQWPQAVTDRKR